MVKLNGELFPRKVNGSRLKPYTSGPAICLAARSTVLMLQAAEKRRGTINYSARELCDVRIAHSSEVSQGPRQREGSCTAARVGWKVTITVTIHDVMLGLRPNGAGGGHLR